MLCAYTQSLLPIKADTFRETHFYNGRLLSPKVWNEKWLPVAATEQDNIEINLFYKFYKDPL